MEFLLLLAIGFLVRGAMEHSKGDRGRSRDQRVKEVAKSFPKGALPKSRQRSAARHAAAGWWAREVRHGFPVHRTGWHAAWLAHQTVADHHKARREEARTTALETRASVLKGMPEHKQRQAEAQAELDKIEEELAARRAKGSPATGRKAVESAADEVERKRKARQQGTGAKCPGCGAPDGYEHLEGCDPTAPPLPASDVRTAADYPRSRMFPGMPPREAAASPEVVDTPARLHNAEDSQWLKPGEPRCEGCGGSGRNAAGNDACSACRGFGSAAPDPDSPRAPKGAVCGACGQNAHPGDPVLATDGGYIHRSHAVEQQEAYQEALNRERGRQRAEAEPGTDAARNPQPIRADVPAPSHVPDGACDCGLPACRSGWPEDASPATPSPTTQGAPVTDTNYDVVMENARKRADEAEQDAVAAAQRHQAAMQHAEDMQAVGVQGNTLSAQMELVDQLKHAEDAAKATGEQAVAVRDALAKEHGGIKSAVDDAPIPRPAETDFYVGS